MEMTPIIAKDATGNGPAGQLNVSFIKKESGHLPATWTKAEHSDRLHKICENLIL